ncbi:Protein N-acetyltransferase, RimJ/RimL family [Duganella sp. CF402]|uniref:GNAT family N-acetyltransferase n=1 Tax=unclassified Duganella TaxID=2636909 RepID=UPI0008D0C2F2|nr:MULTISPECIES: GNAT family N-acetyltransferase [unclassified Duganella]RZT10057.1 RimJ/RimL family protein N-acetyltransferase [Duganella sp. BK701]SEL30404.1 Protein N-acetyltransferase, RimJ/RimL family [Duganella sp. CF402]
MHRDLQSLESERLVLAPLSDEHFPALAEINGNADVMRYIGGGRPQTLEESQAMIDRVKLRWQEHGYSWWALLRKTDGLMVGAAVLQPIEGVTGATPEIGWRLRPDCQGQGYATEVARRIVDWARELGMPELLAVAHPDNSASRAVMERLGMQFRGIETHYKVPCATYVLKLR